MKININKAKKLLNNSELIILPTETVYGLAGDATNLDAIKKIYKLKKRPKTNPLICHFKNLNDVKKNFFMNKIELKLAKKFWPGPLTIVLKKKESSKIEKYLSNNSKFVACRVPKHKVALKLLKNIDFPLAAPSANMFTKLSSTSARHLVKKFYKNIFLIDGGDSNLGLESTVIKSDNKSIKILRLGSITHEQLIKIFPNTKIVKRFSNLSPGQYKRHYSPNKKIRINVKKVNNYESLLNFGKNSLRSKILELNLSPSGNLKEAAKNFYNYLHILDNHKTKGIAVAPIPNHKLGKTINDRLKRASSI